MKISIFDKLRFDLAYSINKLLYCISNNPYYIGGTGRFDSDLIKITKGRIFFLGVGGSASNCSHAVNDFRKIIGVVLFTNRQCFGIDSKNK